MEAEPKWVEEANAKRVKLDMSLKWRPWTGLLGVELRGLSCTPRQQEMVDLAWAEACTKAGVPMSSMELARNLVCDPTQSVKRCKPLAARLGSLCVASRYYWLLLVRSGSGVVSCRLVGVDGVRAVIVGRLHGGSRMRLVG